MWKILLTSLHYGPVSSEITWRPRGVRRRMDTLSAAHPTDLRPRGAFAFRGRNLHMVSILSTLQGFYQAQVWQQWPPYFHRVPAGWWTHWDCLWSTWPFPRSRVCLQKRHLKYRRSCSVPTSQKNSQKNKCPHVRYFVLRCRGNATVLLRTVPVQHTLVSD